MRRLQGRRAFSPFFFGQGQEKNCQAINFLLRKHNKPFCQFFSPFFSPFSPLLPPGVQQMSHEARHGAIGLSHGVHQPILRARSAERWSPFEPSGVGQRFESLSVTSPLANTFSRATMVATRSGWAAATS